MSPARRTVPTGPSGGSYAVRLLARRALRAHRRAWAAVFVAAVLTSALLGTSALTAGSAALGHARVDRYAAAPVVVAGDQSTRHTVQRWDGTTETARTALTERVRLPERTARVLREVAGVRAAVADRSFAAEVRPAGAGSAGAGPATGLQSLPGLQDVRTDAETVRTPGRAPYAEPRAAVGVPSEESVRNEGAESVRDGGAQAVRNGGAQAVRSAPAVPVQPARTALGRPWAAARLAPYALTRGEAPRTAGEVVVGGGLAARPGDEVVVRAGGRERAYRVAGVAGGPAAVYFTEGEARRLAGRAGRVGGVDAVGVLAEPGVSPAVLHGRVRQALDRERIVDLSAGKAPRAYTGDGRGAAENLLAAPARQGTIELVAAVGGTILIVAALVLCSLVAQALRQRAAELALLRAVGATPRQIRAAVGREAVRVCTAAALLGAALAVPAHLALRQWLRGQEVFPDGLELPLPWWLCAGVLLTAALTLGLARLVVPLARVGAGQGPDDDRGTRPGNGRRITGLVLLAAGASASGSAVLQSGQTAAAMVSTAVVTMVAGCAVLGPWIARATTRVMGGPLRRLAGPAGRLAAAACGANTARLGAAMTPVVLMTAFAAVQLSAGATLQKAGDEQAVRALRADFAVTGAAAERVREAPGVGVATEVLRGTVVLAGSEAGMPRLERLPVLGVTPSGLARTLDPGAVAGDLDGLGRPGAVAVGADRAKSLGVRPGSTLTLRMGDGAERRLRVAAVYERSLALGDFLLSRADLARHTTSPDPARVLVRAAPGADPAAVRTAVARLDGAHVDPSPAPERLTPDDQRAGAALSTVAVAAIGGLTAVTVLTTLALITTGRRPELALLRSLGAGRRQLRRMLRAEAAVVTLGGLTLGAAVALVPLLAFARTTTDGLPHLPLPHAAAVALSTAAVGYAGTLGPAWGSLRRERV